MRLLMPVGASLALVAVLIGNGIRVNRTRLGAYADSQRQAIDHMRRFQAEALEYLRVRQGADGSWMSEVDATLRILLNVRRAGYAEEPLFAEGLRFAEERSPRAPSTDLARILLGPGSPEGAPAGARRAISPEPGGPPAALGTDVLRLGTLPPDGEEAWRLLESIRSRLRGDPPPAPAWLTLGYLGTLAAESGSPTARALLPDIIEGFRSRVGPDPWDDLDDPALAAYVELVGRDCRARNDPCQEGNRALKALVERRRPDGSWAGGDITLGDGRREASDPETTSLALAAISAFEEVLALRFGL